MIIVNSPHNPTGRVFSREELQRIADLVIEHDLIAITDEVYEHLVFDGLEHIPLVDAAGHGRAHALDLLARQDVQRHGLEGRLGDRARDRSSPAVRAAKQFLTFAGATPFQHAGRGRAAAGRRLVRARSRASCRPSATTCATPSASFTVARPQGTYFANVDVGTNAVEFARELPYKAGVVAIPTVGVQRGPATRLAPYLRFAFCKRLPVIDEAARRLHALES